MEIIDDLRSDIDLLENDYNKFRRGEITREYAESRIGMFENLIPVIERQIREAEQPDEKRIIQGLLANYKVSLDTLKRALRQGGRRKTLRRKRKNGKKRRTTRKH